MILLRFGQSDLFISIFKRFVLDSVTFSPTPGDDLTQVRYICLGSVGLNSGTVQTSERIIIYLNYARWRCKRVSTCLPTVF